MALLVIDERPIRVAALKAYRRAEKQVGRARGKLGAFDTVDRPAFVRWEAQVFGPLMTELRQVTADLQEKNHLLALIKEERFWANCSRLEAYRRVMEARNNPSPPPTGESFDQSIPRPRVFGASDLPPGFDIDQFDGLSNRDKARIYELYEEAALMFEMVHGLEAPQFEDLLAQERARRGSTNSQEPPPVEFHVSPAPPPSQGADWDRIKELYRTLVRRLHPDMGGANTSRERDLWQQVQDAYQARDLEWLESIAGRLEAVHQGGSNLSIQILRRMTGELLRALHGLRTQVTKLRRHPGWKFHDRTMALAKFEARRRQTLERQLATQRLRLQKAKDTLDKLADQLTRKRDRKSMRPLGSYGSRKAF
jgi:hypothetical protein